MKFEINKAITVYVVSLLYDMYDDNSSIDSFATTSAEDAVSRARKIAEEFAIKHEIPTDPHNWGDETTTQFVIPVLNETVMIEDCLSNRLFVNIKTCVL